MNKTEGYIAAGAVAALGLISWLTIGASRAFGAAVGNAMIPPVRRPPDVVLGQEQIDQIQLAERQLQVLGYYNGPIDGVATDAFLAALQSFQRDQGLTPRGYLDEGAQIALADAVSATPVP